MRQKSFNFSVEFVYQLFSLLIIIIIVHTAYVGVIRPNADAFLAKQAEFLEQDKSKITQRSIYVILKDYEQEVEISLREVYQGTSRVIQKEGRRLEVSIPPGARPGTRVRAAGEGGPGVAGGEAGDLYLRVKVRPDPQFERATASSQLAKNLDGRVIMARIPLIIDLGNPIAVCGFFVTIHPVSPPKNSLLVNTIPSFRPNDQREPPRRVGKATVGATPSDRHTPHIPPRPTNPSTRHLPRLS